jgi:hypothetical protein
MIASRPGICLALSLAALLALGGCKSTKRALGLEKTAPDEFAVLNRGPLVMPPDFNLRPPVPGAARPQEAPAAEQARSALIGRAKLDSLRSHGMSRGEVAFLSHAGAGEAPSDVRPALDREASSFAPEDKKFTHKLLDWHDEGLGEGVAIDPVAEGKRLAQNKAEGKAPNEGKVPTIGKGGSSGDHKFLGIF